MKIKSVAVLGAGAVGSYVIWGLSEKSDIRLGVIAEGERAERLKKNGCAINGKIYHPEVWTPDEAHDVDLMVVALRYGSLDLWCRREIWIPWSTIILYQRKDGSRTLIHRAE